MSNKTPKNLKTDSDIKNWRWARNKRKKERQRTRKNERRM